MVRALFPRAQQDVVLATLEKSVVFVTSDNIEEHIFHNCKRRTIGLKETRRTEWLLDIEFRKREQFAYSCEAYSRILERAKTATQRRELATEYRSIDRISAERVDPAEVADIVSEAAAVRNGWKVILARCAQVQSPRRMSGTDVAPALEP